IVPKGGAGADALLRELGGRVAGKRVLVARPEGGNPALVAGLRAAGAEVETCTLYRTVTPHRADPAALRELRDGRIDAIAFATGADPGGLLHAGRGRSLGRRAAAQRGSRTGARRAHDRIQRGTPAGGAPRGPLDGEAVRHQPPAGARAVAGARRMNRPAGLETIIVYKLTKAVLQALVG